VRSEISNPGMQSFFDRLADAAGITNGQMTREQFTNAMTQFRAARGGAGQGGSGAAGNQQGGRGRGQGGRNPDSWAETTFQQLDKNGDGVLNSDEMPDELKAELDKWDTDHNGLIDLNEYKAYFQARMQQRMADRQGAQGQGQQNGPIYVETPAPQEDPRPVVYHSDNLPKELPTWFAQLDTDKDAQIGLYEWKVSGRSLAEFRAIDRNNDGFLTVEEVLYWQSQQKGGAGQAAASGATAPSFGDNAGSRPNFGGNGGFRRNNGGGGGFRRNNGGGGGPFGQ